MASFVYKSYLVDARGAGPGAVIAFLSLGGTPIVELPGDSVRVVEDLARRWIDAGVRPVVVQTNVFVPGALVSLGDPWALASSASRTAPASGVVLTANTKTFSVETISGRLVPLPSHGLGPAGIELWLGTFGSFSTVRPTGQDGKIRQRVGRIWSPDQILFNLEWPIIV